MAAIAQFDEPYARLLRGFVELGVPDGTRSRSAAGDLSVEQLLRQSGGILLRFPAAASSMDDGWVYTVKVIPGKGQRVAVRCAETLFRYVFDGANVASGETLAGTILATVREQNRIFGEWVDQGGEVSRVERAEHPDDPADTLHPDLLRWLSNLYRQGRSLNDGPGAGWWASAPVDRKALGAAIGVGAGAEPFYRLGPDSPQGLDAAHQQHLDRLRTAGTMTWVVAALMMLAACSGLSFHSWQSYTLRSIRWESVIDVVGGGVSILWLLLGRELRATNRRWIFRKNVVAGRIALIVLASIGMVPAPCCLGGLPVAVWVIYLLVDPRAKLLLKG